MKQPKAMVTSLDNAPNADKIREALIARLLLACEKMPIAQLHMIVSAAQEAIR